MSMPKRKVEPAEVPCPENLGRELEALSRLIRDFSVRDCVALDPNSGDRVVALARLCRDLPVEEWQALSQQPDFKQWLAFPLNAAAYPYLVQLQERLDNLAYQSDHDAMTGVYNRRAFERLLDQEMQRVQREAGHLSLAILDVDNFKKVNDTYGHPCGDEVLIALARAVVTSKRTYDIAARLGGEEFSIILPGIGPQKAASILERMLKLFRAKTFRCADTNFNVTFSAGVASTNGSRKTRTTELLAIADKALYQAKAEGKNRVNVQRMPSELEVLRTTMVHADEKKFLFSGMK